MVPRRKVIWSGSARASLKNILDFYRMRNGSPSYGNSVYRKIKVKLGYILRGIWEGERVAGDSTHRMIFVDAILVFYKEQGGSVIVTKVVDARRDRDE